MNNKIVQQVTKTCESCDAKKSQCIDLGSSRTCFKLWICDVHFLSPSPVREKAFIFRNRSVERVIVFGTITDIKEFKSRVLYEGMLIISILLLFRFPLNQ